MKNLKFKWFKEMYKNVDKSKMPKLLCPTCNKETHFDEILDQDGSTLICTECVTEYVKNN